MVKGGNMCLAVLYRGWKMLVLSCSDVGVDKMVTNVVEVQGIRPWEWQAWCGWGPTSV